MKNVWRTDRQTDRRTDWTIHRAARSQLKMYASVDDIWKCIYSHSNITEGHSWKDNWRQVSTVLCNDLVPKRQHSFIRNSVDHILSRHIWCHQSTMSNNHPSQYHYTGVIMSAIASQITSLRIVYSTVYSDADQRNIKAPPHWPMCGEVTGDRWIPRTNGHWRGKCFHLMTSSWLFRVYVNMQCQ